MRDFGDIIDSFKSIDRKQLLFESILAIANDLGFESVIADFTGAGARFAVTNHDEEWQKQSLELPLEVVMRDPVLTHMFSSPMPIAWSRDSYLASGLLSIHDACSDFGLTSGLATALHGVKNHHFCLGFSTSRAAPLGERDLMTASGTLLLLASVAFHAAERCVADRSVHSLIDVRLTARELEVLRWTRDGKSGRDCAQLMGVSIDTVRYHVKNICRKLGAQDKYQAVYFALERKMID